MARGSQTSEFIAYVLELIAPLGSASSRAMFGGHGIFVGGQIIAIVADDTLYFKTDDETRPHYDKRGLEPFTYTANGQTYAMSYCRAPEETFDAPHEMLPWARAALGAALRSAAAKSTRKKKPAAKPQPKPKSLTSKKR